MRGDKSGQVHSPHGTRRMHHDDVPERRSDPPVLRSPLALWAENVKSQIHPLINRPGICPARCLEQAETAGALLPNSERLSRIGGTTQHRSVLARPFGPASKEAPPQVLYDASGLGPAGNRTRVRKTFRLGTTSVARAQEPGYYRLRTSFVRCLSDGELSIST
jgi:hypothetical protein